MAMMQVGNNVTPATVEALGEAIVKILDCSVDQATLVKALETLTACAKIDHITVQNCTFTNGKSRT